MSKKLRIAVFKLIDIMVIFTMVFASPMSMTASALTQDSGPALTTDESAYASGDSARVTGSGFAAGDYVLAAKGPDGTADWDTVTVDESGVFVSDSPALDSPGTYEVRAYASDWSGNWDETPVASASFTVSAPPPPTETPTEEPTATEPPTAEPTNTPTDEPTAEPTNTPTEEPTPEPTSEPTNTPTEEPTATEPPTEEPTSAPTETPTEAPTATSTDTPTSEPTAPPTETPTNTPTPSGPPTIVSDKDDYFPGELVTLTGTNWQGDTEVRIVVNDDVGQTWKRDVIVTVAGDGTIYDSFNLPAWFVATYFVTATGQQTGRMVNYSFTDSDGSYSLDFSAADPGDSPTYPKVTPGQLACPAPSGGTGRAADPLANAIFGNPNDSVESLAPEDMILGQIVPFETEIRVNGTVAPEGGRIKIVQTFLTKTTSGGNFGFDPAYGIYCAFIDTADSANSTLAAGTKVESFSFIILQPGTANERIEATIIVSGLVNPERAVLETWVVLKNSILSGISGNVQTSIGPAQTCTNAGCTTGGSISTGNQTVPLLRVQEFFSSDADLAVTKSDSPDPVLQGSQLTYTINVTNNGPATANNIVVTDVLDSNTSYVSSSISCSGTTTLTCSVGNLDVGASTSFTITVLVSSSAPTAITPGTNAIGGTCTAGSQDLCNLVSVDAINNDPTSGNNSDSEPTNVLPLGGITINKVTLGGDATFAYTTTGTGLSGFNITTTSGSGSQSFTNIAPGAKAVTESAPPAGWDFTSLSCSDPDGGTTTSGQTANIDLDPGESITCTYTNTKRGTIIVEKQTDPDGAIQDFTFTGDAAGTISDGEQITVSNLVPGTYTSTESDPGPAYGLTSIACDDGSSTTPSTFNLGTRTASFNLDPGETVKCTFTNTLQQGTLTVIKTVVNDNGGTATSSQWSLHVTSGGTDVAGSPQPGSATGTDYSLTQGTYNVSETGGPSGYTFTGFSGDCDASGNVTVVAGQTKTCTLTNNDQPGTLIVKKVMINDNGGTLEEENFTFQVNGGAAIAFEADGQNDLTVNAGTYTVTEPAVSGYSTTYDNCTDIVVPNGGSATCTVTNDDQAATLIVKKLVVNDNGGMLEADDFSFSVNGGTLVAFEADGQNDLIVDAGTYSVTEPAVSGYTTTYDNCSNLVIPNGGTATCTITNDDVAPVLHLRKVIVNDNGGSATAADFTLTADGTGTNDLTGTSPVDSGPGLQADTWALSETNVPGYTASAWSCVGGTQNGSNITLTIGQEATCTITNDDQQAYITVVKVVANDNGGSADPDDFNLTLEGNPVLSGIAVPVNPGTYTAGETLLSGYTFEGFAGDCDVNGDITVALGESKTCTLTNNDVAPTLTLIKIVVNDDGGNAMVGDFPLFINGSPVTSGVANSLSANTLYTATETSQPGYTASVWGGDCAADGTITLNEGENKTCTITNDDVAPILKLVKMVNNDNGGNNAADDWVLYAIASAPNDGRNFSNLGGSGDFETVFANTAYDLSESVVAGYTAGSWSCTGGTLAGSTVTLGEGEINVTCTITNNDSAPTLTLIKVVVNDDGGNAVVSDFPLFINGNPTTSGQSNILSANTLYTASETNLAGYTASAWGGDCNADGTITLSEGQNATCTITNNDVAPTLKLVKVVDNGDGGDAVADDWNLSAAAADPFDGRNFSNAGGSGDFETIFANQGYELSETTLPGYTAGNWSCDGGSLVGSTVTVGEGENVTCTIINDDVAPQLRIVKTVVNDDGGNAVISDFPLFIDGNAVTSGVFVPVTANEVHTATETTQPGYTASAWGGDCNADGTITLNEGDVKTCTITNDDVAPTLKLVKEVNNDDGGNAVADDWTLSADADAPFDDRNFSNLGGSGDFETVFANAGYDLSESTVPGYTAGAWECDGGTLVGSTITLTEGETEVTCTITNDDSAPTLTLIKVVVNDNGGNAAPNDFNLTIGGSAAISGTTYTLDANTPYAIDETLLSGYSFVEITGDPECPAVLGGTVTLKEGENVTCTITNDDVAPTLTLIKNVINDSGGTAEPDDFNLTIGGNAATSGTAYPVNANTPYAIDETLVTGYGFVSITGDPECPTELGGTVTLDEGENVTCTITNDDQAATLIIIKHVINDNGGTADAADFTLDSGGTDDTPDNFPGEEAPGTTVTLDAGAYNVTESGPSGYSASLSTDCSGTIANGQTKTCTVTNDDIQPELIVIKHVINDNGGTADAGDFTMEVSGNNVNPVNFAGAEAPGTNVALDAGTYSVTETGPEGYAPSFSADCTGSITVGETKTCTITNNDISPTLTVIKDLLPSNDTGLFNLQIDGVTQAANVGDNGTTGPVAVDAGVVHTVGETAGTGTSLSDYVTSISGDCALDGTVTLALAENKTCTITNVRRGSIVIVKNTLGGNGTFDFTSTSFGSFSLTTSGGTASTTFSGLDPKNTYEVAETVPAGWELNSATCNSGETIDSIDLDPGETVTCTFENEKAGNIVIVKNTVGGNGTFDFTSSTLGNFSLTTASNTASITFSNLDLDVTYDVAETVPTGWDLTGATCNGGETIDSIDLNPGETVTCTFTNTKHGHIIVDKVTLPSGDTQSFAFTTTGIGYTGFNLTDAAAANDQELVPGTYSVTETAVAGWDLTSLSCSDPSGAPVITGNKATINLAAGETVNCTFTNRKRGTITIVKDALPNDAQDFAFTSTIPGAASFSLDDDSNATLLSSKTVINLVPGAYSVTEVAVAGWDLTGLTCNDANGTTNPGMRTANIALDPGENVTCTFTNTKRGTIIVEKQTNPNAAPGLFTFTGTAAGTIADNGTITVNNLVPGTYTSTEADPSVSLFALTSITCNDVTSANPSTVNLATRTATFKLDPGETVKCVFTNTKDFHAGTIGFWKNWRNHYSSSQFQLLINYLKANNPKVYNKDLINNTADDLTIAKHDVIMNVGTSTPREQMILAQFTALKFNLAITQLDGTSGLVQKNDDLCTAGIVDVSGISGATTFFGTSTPTVGQIVNEVENRWIGKMTTNRSDWKWNLTNAQKDMLINVISGINEGTLVMSSGCP